MKKSFILPATLLMGGALFAQAKQDRSVGSFNKIDVSNAVHVELSMGNQESVTVEAEEDIMKNIKTEVKNSELKIYTEGKFCSEKGILVHVTAKNLSAIEVSGASYLEARDRIKSDKLDIQASGASKVKADVKADQLAIDLSGASSARISGETDKLKAEVSGASSLKAEDLKSKETEVNAEGAARASVQASDHLNASASGASNVRFSGDPKNKNLDARGASHIQNAHGSETAVNRDGEETMYDSNGKEYKMKKSGNDKRSQEEKRDR